MTNGRCWVHGGAPNPVTDVPNAIKRLVRGRAAWAVRQKAAGLPFSCGRKGGSKWVTERMRQRALAETHELGAACAIIGPGDRRLVWALLVSAKARTAAMAEEAMTARQAIARRRAIEMLRQFIRIEQVRQVAGKIDIS